MSPVCSNCGASDFVWANDLKTGSIGGGTLSLRSRGELSLGTRICRACGHADLFLKDPSVLRMPHTWRPGEFVPIPARPAAETPAHAHHAAATSPAPAPAVPSPAPMATPAPPVAAPAPPPPPPTPPSPEGEGASAVEVASPPPEQAAPPVTTEEPPAPSRRSGRRRTSRSKSSDSD